MVLLLSGWSLRAQVGVAAELDTTHILIGDQVRLTLRISHPPQVRITRIDWEALKEEPAIDVISPGQLDTVAVSPEILLKQTLVFTVFDSGYFRLPPIPVYYIDGGREGLQQTNDLGLEVRTFPITTDTARLAPIKPIVEEPARLDDALPYVVLIALAGLLIAAIVLLLRRRRPRATPPPPPPRPAHELALEQLQALRAAQLWQRGDIRPFQTELTRIVREYLENRFQLPALESTTEEIIARLPATGISAEWAEQLRQMLRTADMVKFAKAVPPVTIHEEMLQRAGAFVEDTREPDVPVENEEVENK